MTSAISGSDPTTAAPTDTSTAPTTTGPTATSVTGSDGSVTQSISGLSSGLDTNAIIASLVAAERASREDPVNAQIAADNAKLLAYAEIAADAATLQSAAQGNLVAGVVAGAHRDVVEPERGLRRDGYRLVGRQPHLQRRPARNRGQRTIGECVHEHVRARRRRHRDPARDRRPGTRLLDARLRRRARGRQPLDHRDASVGRSDEARRHRARGVDRDRRNERHAAGQHRRQPVHAHARARHVHAGPTRGRGTSCEHDRGRAAHRIGRPVGQAATRNDARRKHRDDAGHRRQRARPR